MLGVAGLADTFLYSSSKKESMDVLTVEELSFALAPPVVPLLESSSHERKSKSAPSSAKTSSPSSLCASSTGAPKGEL